MNTYRVSPGKKKPAYNSGVVNKFDANHAQKMSATAKAHEVKKIENQIKKILESARINKFACSQGMMGEFHVNGFKIKDDGNSYMINGESLDKIEVGRLTRIRNLLENN